MSDGSMTEVIRQLCSPPPCPSCLGGHMESRGWQPWPWRLRRSCRHWSWSAAPSDCHWSPHSHSARCRHLLLAHSRLSPRCQDREVTWKAAPCFYSGADTREGILNSVYLSHIFGDPPNKSDEWCNGNTNFIRAYNSQVTPRDNVWKTTHSSFFRSILSTGKEYAQKAIWLTSTGVKLRHLWNTHHVSWLLNFFVTTFASSRPKRSAIFWDKSACELPLNILMLGILLPSRAPFRQKELRPPRTSASFSRAVLKRLSPS